MLDENYLNIVAIVDAIIYVHRNGRTPTPLPPGLSYHAASGELTITYGHKGTPYGSIVIKRGQFEVAKVSNSAGALVELGSYGHTGEHSKMKDYEEALKCKDLTKSQHHVSALVIMTAECCRSSMVLSVIKTLMARKEAGSFSNHVWQGVHFAITNYRKTCEFKGYKFNAGESPWTSLRADDYLGYIKTMPDQSDKKGMAEKIVSVKDYIKNEPG